MCGRLPTGTGLPAWSNLYSAMCALVISSGPKVIGMSDRLSFISLSVWAPGWQSLFWHSEYLRQLISKCIVLILLLVEIEGQTFRACEHNYNEDPI